MVNIQIELLSLTEGNKDLSLRLKLRISGCQRFKNSVNLTITFSICPGDDRVTDRSLGLTQSLNDSVEQRVFSNLYHSPLNFYVRKI